MIDERRRRLRPLTVTLNQRIPALPDVPTVLEVGMPELEMSAWGAFFAPSGTPRPVIDQLNSTIKQAMSEPEVLEIYRNLGAHVAVEMERWARVVDRAGIRVEQ
jgi:tripartite-type tricarboxylate transporter receptor subunit TctC